jgi:hypothetical protein
MPLLWSFGFVGRFTTNMTLLGSVGRLSIVPFYAAYCTWASWMTRSRKYGLRNWGVFKSTFRPNNSESSCSIVFGAKAKLADRAGTALPHSALRIWNQGKGCSSGGTPLPPFCPPCLESWQRLFQRRDAAATVLTPLCLESRQSYHSAGHQDFLNFNHPNIPILIVIH